MGGSYACSVNVDPDARGNMYYRGDWEYCPEYRTGDVVRNNGVLYLCISPHAGQEPPDGEYWYEIGGSSSSTDEQSSRKAINGGFASTSAEGGYKQTEQTEEVNGGSSSEAVRMPLI